MAHLESLVVLDGNARSAKALSFGFERAGYSVYATQDGGDALAMAQTRVVQLIVVSTQGSDPETLDVVGKVRDAEPTRELPVVVLGERRSREAALRAGADEFVARPAFLRDVVTLSKLAVAMRQDGDGDGVIGMLEDYGLYFLVRALAVAGRSGVLELSRGKRRGELHFVKGDVVAARCGRMSGITAFMQLLLWSEAEIHLRFSSPSGERKINLNVDELLQKGAQFAREFEKLAQKIGGARAVYRHLATRAAEARAQIPPEVMGLVKLYDGRRTVVDIVEDSPFKPHDTVKITYRLAELRAIERVDETRADSPLTAQLAVRDWLLGAAADEVRSTVTEAGRRAAEAYAEEQAKREAEPRPSADLFAEAMEALRPLQPEERAKKDRPGGTGSPAAQGSPAAEPAAPAVTVEDVPTAPREVPRGPQARNKKKNKHKYRAQPQTPAQSSSKAPESPLEAAAAKLAPEIEATIPFNKISVPPPVPADGKYHSPPKSFESPKLSPQAAANANAKENVFDELEEDFFSRESEHLKSGGGGGADNFDDLDSGPKRKIDPPRRWFGLGASKKPPPQPTPSPSKKR